MRRLTASFRRYTRFQRNAGLYLLSNALSGMTTGIFLILYNLYLTSLGYRADFVGAVLFVGTLGAGLAIFPAGLCVDRWSGKWILIIISLLMGVVGVGTILLRQPGPLLASAFLTGIVTAFLLVINAPFLSRNSQPEERPDLFSLNIAVSQITTVAGEILGGVLPLWFAHSAWWMAPLPFGLNLLLDSHAGPRSYQLAMLVAGLIAIPSFIPLFLLREEPRVRPEKEGRLSMPGPAGSETSGVAVKSEIPDKAGRGAIKRPSFSGLRMWSEFLRRLRAWTRPEFLRRVVRSPFFILALVQTLTGLGAGLFIPYFNLFFVQHLNASSALFGLIDGGANGLLALTTLFAPWLARKIGRVNSILLTRLSSLPLLLAIGFTGSLPLAALLYPLREGLMDMSAGVLLVFSMEEVPERHRGLANSVYQSTFQGAWAITSSIGGLIIVSAGYSPLFIGAALCYLTTLILLWARFRTRKGGKLPE